MQSQETLCTGYAILSQISRLCWLKLVCAFWDGFRTALQEFGDICTVDFACPCLHEMLLIGPMTRPRTSWGFRVSLFHNFSDPCCARYVHTGDLEPLFLRYWLELDLCDSVSAFWYSREDEGLRVSR